MAEITVQKIESVSSGKRIPVAKQLALLCYYYPQYDLQKASKLPAKHLNLLLRVAIQERAKKMHDFLQIAIVPHSKDKDAAKKLSDHFRKLAED